MSEFMDALRGDQEEEVDNSIEAALDIAIAALKEIKYCAAAGSINLCEIEANDALSKIDMMNVLVGKEPVSDEPTVPNIVVFE